VKILNNKNMNSLEKKLTKNARNTVSEGEAILSDAKLLLDQNAQEEINVLRSIGLDVDIKIIHSKKEDILIRKKAAEHLGKKIVHKKEIEKFCSDYRLYMRRASEYAGRIPNDLGADLARYCKDKNIVLTHSSYSMFSIIAPPKMFVDYKSPVDVVVGAFKEVERERQERIAERKRLRDLDPILVYQLPEDSNYYAIIRSWGNDFTFLRRIYGFFTKKSVFKTTYFLFNALVIFAL
jgi:hypothetical protein